MIEKMFFLLLLVLSAAWARPLQRRQVPDDPSYGQVLSSVNAATGQTPPAAGAAPPPPPNGGKRQNPPAGTAPTPPNGQNPPAPPNGGPGMMPPPPPFGAPPPSPGSDPMAAGMMPPPPPPMGTPGSDPMAAGLMPPPNSTPGAMMMPPPPLPRMTPPPMNGQGAGNGQQPSQNGQGVGQAGNGQTPGQGNRQGDGQENGPAGQANGEGAANGQGQGQGAANTPTTVAAKPDLGSATNPTVVYCTGFDEREEFSYQSADMGQFTHGSAQDIKTVTEFICDRLNDKYQAPEDTVDQCRQALTQAEKRGGKAAADSFNAAMGFADPPGP